MVFTTVYQPIACALLPSLAFLSHQLTLSSVPSRPVAAAASLAHVSYRKRRLTPTLRVG